MLTVGRELHGELGGRKTPGMIQQVGATNFCSVGPCPKNRNRTGKAPIATRGRETKLACAPGFLSPEAHKSQTRERGGVASELEKESLIVE